MTTPADGTAILVMDVQPGILARLPDHAAYLERVRDVVQLAHQRGVPVVHVVVGFRPDLPEISPRNKAFSGLTKEHATGMIDPQPAIAPTGTDVVVIKRRVSAFTGSDLEVILRAREIRHLVLAGIATSGVVLSTVREAADKDYQLTVLSDLCADPDPEVHAVLLDKVLPRQADVITCDEWRQRL